MRLCVRVRPGAGRTAVGGRYGEDTLVVAVRERAVAGAATEAALRALSDALAVPRNRVRLVTGRTGRTKVLEISDPPDDLTSRLQRLLEGPNGRGD